ncbi:MAG: hypothetical protein GY696_37780, partial [Gammaproteobacteria bacterium]|nr:hypothetical protein [Gammaproteobacteria bacterium]
MVHTYDPELDMEESWDEWRLKFERSVNDLSLTPEQKKEATVLMLRGSAGEVVMESLFAEMSYDKTLAAVDNWVKRKRRQKGKERKDACLSPIQSMKTAVSTQTEQGRYRKGKSAVIRSEIFDGIVEELRKGGLPVKDWEPPKTTGEVVLFFLKTKYLRRYVV